MKRETSRSFSSSHSVMGGGGKGCGERPLAVGYLAVGVVDIKLRFFWNENTVQHKYHLKCACVTLLNSVGITFSSRYKRRSTEGLSDVQRLDCTHEFFNNAEQVTIGR